MQKKMTVMFCTRNQPHALTVVKIFLGPGLALVPGLLWHISSNRNHPDDCSSKKLD